MAGYVHCSSNNFIRIGTKQQRNKDIKLIDATNAEHDFIAHAYQDISKMLKEIRRLKIVISKNKLPQK
ncbi:hypothetical protein B6D19_05575 [Gilliamella apicola]|uniref:hypothetical protein n=1 Tax=Gilliamella apicola TaxID=1196095 RepID=UPI000A33547F|nr:hypothetical protein [Gilliamella apicola]OTQ32393.1 hypothetical protein B6D19_05575 [Gilliamella apicola]OTQ43948.1 hypothetical protein B6D20_06935 [Gilliamella apicola]